MISADDKSCRKQEKSPSGLFIGMIILKFNFQSVEFVLNIIYLLVTLIDNLYNMAIA